MACSNLVLSTFKGCNDSQGGIKKVYLANQYLAGGATASFTFGPAISTDNTDGGTITGLTANGGAKLFTFVPNKFSSNWTEAVTSNATTGNINNLQTLVMVFSKNEAAKRNQVKLIAQDDFFAIVEDHNDKLWLLGEVGGMALSTGAGASGTLGTDPNGWTITLIANEKWPAREIVGSFSSYISAV